MIAALVPVYELFQAERHVSLLQIAALAQLVRYVGRYI